MSADRTYPAKLLLFGEYTVLSGSRALAIPLHLWQGRLKTSASVTDQDLLHFSNYLDEKKIFSGESCVAFRQVVAGGLYFESNIPRGYGVGSSGALCAAIYDRFFADTADDGDISNIRRDLAVMEGYFHGTSSGMDPLVSLMNVPILRELNSYHLLPGLKWPDGIQLFLLDSGVERTTGHLVQEYLQWTTHDNFNIQCLRPLVQSVDHAISFFINAHLPSFWEHLKLISYLQFDYFRPMMTDSIPALWESTLDEPGIAVKICGAGGGGYYLGFAQEGLDIMSIIGDKATVISILR